MNREMPAKQNRENIISLMDIGHFAHATGWEMAQNSQRYPFISEVIPDFPAGLSCPLEIRFRFFFDAFYLPKNMKFHF